RLRVIDLRGALLTPPAAAPALNSSSSDSSSGGGVVVGVGFPSSWCALHDLQAVLLGGLQGGGLVGAVPGCVATDLPNLQFMDLGASSLDALPRSFVDAAPSGNASSAPAAAAGGGGANATAAAAPLLQSLVYANLAGNRFPALDLPRLSASLSSD